MDGGRYHAASYLTNPFSSMNKCSDRTSIHTQSSIRYFPWSVVDMKLLLMSGQAEGNGMKHEEVFIEVLYHEIAQYDVLIILFFHWHNTV